MNESFIRARRHLLLDHVFFGSLVMHLEPEEDPKARRGLWVDGQTVGYNPEALAALPLAEASGLLAKGVMHCAMRHQLRRGSRNPERWQEACDYSVNPVLVDSGLKLPAGALLDRQRFPDNTPEDIYRQLEEQHQKNNQQKPQPQPGQTPQPGSGPQQDGKQTQQNATAPEQGQGTPEQPGKGKEPQTGEVRDCPGKNKDGQGPTPAEQSAQEQEWKVKLQQATNEATLRGDLPLGLKRTITTALLPATNWREPLRRFFQTLSNDELTWSKPNRRFASAGIQMPAVRGKKMGIIIIVVDTSGSIGGRVLNLFGTEMNAIAEDVGPERIYVMYCDARVNKVDEFDADSYPIKLVPVGGGGTHFEPAFQWVEQQGIVPECLVYLTDMIGSFPTVAPDYPVLWAQVGRGRPAPFGEVINIDTSREA